MHLVSMREMEVVVIDLNLTVCSYANNNYGSIILLPLNGVAVGGMNFRLK